jgi:hypothetical protein
VTITLPLQPKEEERLIAAARAKGLTTAALVREAIEPILTAEPEQKHEAKSELRPIWQAIQDNMKDVTPEEFAELPKDGASELDHYLYGHPRRNT